jgi:hypothetical protein
VKDIIEVTMIPGAFRIIPSLEIIWKMDPWTMKKISWIDPEIRILKKLFYIPWSLGELIETGHMMALLQEVLAEMGTKETRATGD